MIEDFIGLTINLPQQQYDTIIKICEERHMSIDSYIELALDDLIFMHNKTKTKEN